MSPSLSSSQSFFAGALSEPNATSHPQGEMMRTYDMSVDQCKRDNIWEMRMMPHDPESDMAPAPP